MNLTMNRTARIVGALFLISNATFLIGSTVILEPILTAPDYLIQLTEQNAQVITGSLLELVNGLAYMGIALLMFPLFRQRFESLALGYVSFRIIEFVTQIAASIIPLLLLAVGTEFVSAGAPENSAFQALGASLLATRYWTYEMLYLIFCVSALMFYTMLYLTRLVPRFISVWGLIAAVLVLANTLLEIYGIEVSMAVSLVTGLPMLLNELFLGIWLLVKGFSHGAVLTPDSSPTMARGQLGTT